MREQVVELRLDTKGFDRGIRRATAALGALASVATVKTVADLADRFQQVNARLRLVTGSSQNFAQVQQALNRVTLETRGSLEETIDLYSRLARSTQGTAVSQGELLTATTAINQALKVSGAGAQEANAAIIQLGQGLQSGALRGDELRSVLENTTRVAQLIADGLGVTLGELRELGSQNALTTEVVLKAIQSQAPKIAAEFAKIPPTIADAFTALNNEVLESTEVLNQAGFGATLRGIALGVADAIKAVGEAFKELFPERDLKLLERNLRIATLDVIIDILEGIQTVRPALKSFFDFIRGAVNNIIKISNALPPEVRAIGIIGFLLVGRGVKIIAVALTFVARTVAKVLDGMINTFLSDLNRVIGGVNLLIKAVNSLGADFPLLEKFDDTKSRIGDMVDGLELVGLEAFGVNEPLELMLDNIEKQPDAIQKSIDKLKQMREIAANPFMDPTEFSMFAPQTSGPITVPESSKAIEKRQKELKKQLDDLHAGLRSEEEAERDSHQQKLKILDEYYKGRQAFDDNYIKTREQLEIQHSRRIAEIQKSNYDQQLGLLTSGKYAEVDLTKVAEDQKLQFVIEAGGQMLNELGKHNKKAFYAAKAYNIGQAIMNTALGVTKALSFGPILGPILAGIIIASGAAQIATIAAQEYTGRQFGGYVTGGRPYTVGEAGPETFVPAGSGQIVPNRGGMNDGGTVNINFEIKAIDASGVDQIILQRKALITNIVREGMENQGRRSVV